MALKSDSSGFLVGEKDTRRVTPPAPDHPSRFFDDDEAQGRMLDLWDRISGDVASIRTSVERSPNLATAGRPRETKPAAVPVAQPARSRDIRVTIPVVAASSVAAVPQAKASGQGPQRDASGRFVARHQSDAEGGAGERTDPGGRKAIMMEGRAAQVGQAVSNASAGAGDVDPTLRAFSEVAQPITQGYSALSSIGPKGPARNERWFRRLFRELNLFRKEETAFSKATSRTLKDIEKKPAETGSGGSALTILPAILAAMIPVLLGLLKKVPIVGGLLSGGMNLLDLFKSENDDSLSRGEKDVRSGRALGGLGGVIAGGAAGAKMGAAVGALGGPIGVAIGAAVGGAAGMFFGDKAGKVIGETVGGWVADLRAADIPGAISRGWESMTGGLSAAWDSTMSAFSAQWTSVSEAFSMKWAEVASGLSDKWNTFLGELKGLWNGVTEAASKALNWIEEKTGVNVSELPGKAVEAAKSAGNAANEFVKKKTGVDVASTAADAVETVKSGVQSGMQAARDGAAWVGDKAAGAANWASEKAGAARSWFTGKVSGAFSSTDEKLEKGFRQKHSFDGIAGGASLAKNGTYTAEEAQRIRELKASGANTSANLPGGMPAEIQQKIRASAAANGLDPEMMLSIAAMESGGNPNAISSTGATGIFQFTGRTATGVGIKDRFDVDQNIEGGMKLTQQNAAMLQKQGLPVTPENLYMAHQLGPTAAAEVIAGAQSGKTVAELSQSTRAGMGLNFGSGSTTAAEYLAKNAKALDARYQSVVMNSEPGAQPAAPMVAAAENAATPTVAPAKPATSPTAAAVVAMAPAVTASMPAVASPTMPAPPVIAEAPRVATPLGGGKTEPTKVNVTPPDAGQDVRDRQIAHIVTGGLAT